jgi:hypothetical protein
VPLGLQQHDAHIDHDAERFVHVDDVTVSHP